MTTKATSPREPFSRLDSEGAITALIALKGQSLSPPPSALEQLHAAADSAAFYAAARRAANTRRAYEADWRDFASWCAETGLPCDLDAGGVDGRQVALYLSARAGALAVATLGRRLASIRMAHVDAGRPRPEGPELAHVWAGIRREHGRPPEKKTALVLADLRQVLAEVPNTLCGLRDRAILLVGFAGALRRSELAALQLDVSDAPARVRFIPQGLEVHLDRSKGDQDGVGAIVAIPKGKRADTCPSRALRAWLDAARITTGPAFRAVSPHGRVSETAIAAKTVAAVVKRGCERAGFDPSSFAGHSLRAGMATTAAEAGVAGHVIQDKLRHRKFDTTHGYIRAAERFASDASGKVGL